MENAVHTEQTHTPEPPIVPVDPPDMQTEKDGWERLDPPDWETLNRPAAKPGASPPETHSLPTGGTAGVVAAVLLAAALVAAFLSPAGEPVLRFLAEAAALSARVSFLG